ncbi:BRO-N domain-containing protein [Rhodopseudomonas palustris]|uniref:BRO-N domain-containing protein n=1 Tax=Rhodopseudomonas palustris TaxID=1076 RepID=UPI00069BEEDD|nr:BRO family protein [Rhodopseudomonas palustris]
MTLDGDPWFVAAEVCRLLGLDTSEVARTVRADEKARHLVPTLGGPQQMVTVSGPGLYRLITRSDKPIVGPFQDGVVREVLPSIRKTGSYAHQPARRCPSRRPSRTPFGGTPSPR